MPDERRIESVPVEESSRTVSGEAQAIPMLRKKQARRGSGELRSDGDTGIPQ